MLTRELVRELVKEFERREWERVEGKLEIYIGSVFDGHSYRFLWLMAEGYFCRGDAVGGYFRRAGTAWYRLPEHSILIVKEPIIEGKILRRGKILWIAITPTYAGLLRSPSKDWLKYEGEIKEPLMVVPLAEPRYITEDVLDASTLRPLVKKAEWSKEDLEILKSRLREYMELI